MSMNKNIARLAVTAGLTAALSFGGVMAPVTMAFAEDAPATTNIITINNIGDNQDASFKAYQIFKATVTDKTEGKIAQNIEWTNTELGNKVINAIEDWSRHNASSVVTNLPKNPTAQDVAEFLMANAGGPIAGPANGAIKGTRVATGNVLYAVANVVKNETPTASGIPAGQPWSATAGSGYYLFVTDENSLNAAKKNTGTSPIFALVGGGAVTVTEKTSIPTVEKKILDASKVAGGDITGETDWVDAADSQVGQEVNYRLTGTIADNYDSYDTYSYKFKDQLTDGLDYIKGSISVYALNNGEYTEINPTSYDVDAPSESNQRVLTVNFIGTNGLKSATAKNGGTLTINANTIIVVFYKAKLNAKAVIAGANNKLEGNPNTVTLEYSNNPMVAGTGTSAPDTVVDYTYGLKINKVDLGTEKALQGAKFTIAAGDTTNGGENSANVKYVKSDGTLSDSKVELSMDPNGVLTLTGLDAGVYTVTETSAPGGYTKVEPFTFEIKPTMNAIDPNAGLTALSGKLDVKNQSDKVIAGLTDKKAGDNRLTAQDGSDKVTDGYFNITVGDTKQVGLPLTGLNGVTFTWIAGGAVLCIGVAHLIRSRKQAEESEQE
ncbi:Predicted outer membrane protein [Collinsella aerofaciens]|uniref:Predicted outer membrane protein n=2 Tax=Collinsella aerofaciens TaxID=74426 RepID=A0A174EY85_9ACTN|nr:Predicted outer membrane protein [Collinsella aerofaciens]